MPALERLAEIIRRRSSLVGRTDYGANVDVDADYFIEVLKDISSEVRQAAALALAVHPAEKAAPVLVRALNDEDAMVQTLAANALSADRQIRCSYFVEAFPRHLYPSKSI